MTSILKITKYASRRGLSIMLLLQSVVGVSFEGRVQAIKHLKPGDEVLLVKDDHNPHDHNAVEVVDLQGRCLGFIGRNTNVAVRHHMDQYGAVCVVYEVGAPPTHRYLSLKVLLPGAHRGSL